MITGKQPTDDSWHDLLTKAKQGDREALGSLLQQYWFPLWTQAVSQLDRKLDAKEAGSDLVQETYLEAQRAFSDFRGSTPAELQAWLRSILTNNVHDVWRRYIATSKRQIDREVALSNDADLHSRIPSPQPSPSNVLQSQEDSRHVHEVLDTLPEEYQAVIRMRHWENLPFDEIGIRMAKSPDAARQLWYRALETFTERIQKYARP